MRSRVDLASCHAITIFTLLSFFLAATARDISASVAPSARVQDNGSELRYLEEKVQEGLKTCDNLEQFSRKRNEPHHQLAYIPLTFYCYYGEYTKAVSSEISANPAPEDAKACSFLLGLFSNPMEVDYRIYWKEIFHTNSCVVAAHVATLCCPRGRCVDEEGEGDLAKCTAIERSAVSEEDSFTALRLLTQSIRCLLVSFHSARWRAQRRPPEKGFRALKPQLRMKGLAKRISIGKQPAPRRWPPLTFVASKFINCDSDWVAKGPSKLAFMGDLLMKIVAQYVGSPSCVHVNYDETMRKMGIARDYAEVMSVGLGIYDVCTKEQWNALDSGARLLYPHKQGDVCILLKRLELQRRSILESFSGDMWACAAMTWLAFVAAFALAGHRSVLLEAFRTLLTGAFDDRQRPLSNFLSLQLSAFGLIAVSAFSGVFMSFLMVPGEPRQPQTLEEANALITNVMGSSTLKRISENLDVNDTVSKIIAKEERHGNKSRNFVFDTFGYAYIASREELETMQYYKVANDHQGRPLSHIVRQCIESPAYFYFTVRRSFPLQENLSSVVQRLVEGGVNGKISSTFWHKLRMQRYLLPELRTDSDEEPRVLETSDTVEPLVLLGIGLGLAIVAFGLELVAARWQQRRQRERRQELLRHAARRRALPVAHRVTG